MEINDKNTIDDIGFTKPYQNTEIPDSNSTNIGCNINSQLIDLVNIYNNVSSDTDLDENEQEFKFDKLYKQYLEKVETKYNGINNISYKEIKNFAEEIKNNFTFITPEVEFSFEKFSDDKNYSFDDADRIYKFAIDNSLEICVPVNLSISSSLSQQIYDIHRSNPNKAKKMILDLLTKYFNTLGSKYKISEWQVLSNILDVDSKIDDNFLKDSIFKDILGEDYYIDVLKVARDSIPYDTKIIYSQGNETIYKNRQRIIDIVNNIKNYEIQYGIKLLDILSLEGHFYDTISDMDIEDIFKDITILNKDIKFSDLCVLQTMEYPDEQIRVYNSLSKYASLYNIRGINLHSFDDNLSTYTSNNTALFNEDGESKSPYKLFSNFQTKKNNISSTISLMGKVVGAYVPCGLIELFNKFQDNSFTYTDKVQFFNEYKRENKESLNNTNCCNTNLSTLGYRDILTLIENINSNVTSIVVNSNDYFDKSINVKDGTINNSFMISSEFSKFVTKTGSSIEINNLFGKDFCYPNNLDTYLENIYTREDRLLTQKEKNDILIRLIKDYLHSISNELNSKDLKLDSVVVLNNVIDDCLNSKWWEQNFGDDYYVSLFQFVNEELTDNISLSWNEDNIINNDYKRKDFFDFVERIIQHDPFLISFISTNIYIDESFNVNKFNEVVDEINYFCKRMKEEFGSNIKFKISDLYINNNLVNGKYNDIYSILSACSNNNFIGLNISNLLILNSFSFLNGLQNKTLQSYSRDAKNIYDILHNSISNDTSGTILEKNIIAVLQDNHNAILKGILACNSNFSDTFAESTNNQSKSQDFLQIGSSAKHISMMTKKITREFPQILAVVEEATKLGCVDYVDYLSVIPSLYEERVINGETNTISSTINENNKKIIKTNISKNVGFSNYLSLGFITIIFTIIFIICILIFI